MRTSRYFDLQVNGFGGIDFNSDDLTAGQLNRACALMREGGVAGCLATIITDDVERMCRRISRIVRLREQDPLARQIIAGIHIEGPFINPERGYLGAHPADAVISGNVDAARKLTDAGEGTVQIFTLAPECDPGFAVVRLLAGSGIVVSGGHSNADLTTLRAAIDAGMTMFTHLGNGCPALLPRHDNIVQRVLSLSSRLRIGFIADGVHVPIFALKNYLAAAGVENSFVVTDAMAAAGLGSGTYRLGRNEVRVGSDLAARAPDGSHLVGSAVTMAASATLLRENGFADSEIQTLTFDNPMRFIRRAAD